MSIEIHQLTKVFGRQKAIHELSFRVRPGEILGFLGPNGAGKSTTMKIATGYLPPTQGVVKVAGFNVVEQSRQARRNIGYLPEHNPLYPDMFVHEYLGFIASLHGIRRGERKKRVHEMIGICGLTVEQNKKIGSLSKGYRQRVGLAQALIHDPKVLILDEPTTGLDPNQLAEIRLLIRQISRDKTVMLSTHIMQEVKALCHRVVIIDRGKIVADSTVDDLTLEGKGQRLTVEFQSAVPEKALLEALEGVEVANSTGIKYDLRSAGKEDLSARVFRLAAEKGWVILRMQQEESNLEDVFYQLTKGRENVGDL